MIAPTPRDLWQTLPAWIRAAIVFALLVLAVTTVIDPVMRRIFPSLNEAAPPVQEKGKRNP